MEFRKKSRKKEISHSEIVFTKGVQRSINTKPSTRLSLRIIFFSYTKLLIPSALNAGSSNPNKNTITGDTHWWEKTNSNVEFSKGKHINSMQKTM